MMIQKRTNTGEPKREGELKNTEMVWQRQGKEKREKKEEKTKRGSALCC